MGNVRLWRRAGWEHLQPLVLLVLLALMLALAAGCGSPLTALDRAAASGEDAVTRCEEAYARAYVAFTQGSITEGQRETAKTLYRAAQASAIELGLLLRAAKASGDTALADPTTARAVAERISTINQAAGAIALLAAKTGGN
jgi:hypothetical protein